MSERQATRIIATTFLLVVGLIAWRHIREAGGAPPPGRFTPAASLWTFFALAADVGAPGLGATFAIATTAATALRLIDVDRPTGLRKRAARARLPKGRPRPRRRKRVKT